MLQELAKEIEELSPQGRSFKPHRPLLVLSVLNLAAKRQIRGTQVYYNEALRDEFARLLQIWGTVEDRNRPHTPFFHLGGSSFWRLVPAPGCEDALSHASSVGGPTELSGLVQFAELSTDFVEVMQNEELRVALSKQIEHAVARGIASRSVGERSGPPQGPLEALPRIATSIESDTGNPFVAYLNSLIRLSASNENALAEFQAVNPSFALIHVPHPLVESILEELQRPEGRHVILTGHAGDGKSTIALDVYRRLTGVVDGEPLLRPLNPREDLPAGPSIIKDLSERQRNQDEALMAEILGGHRKFLIVSNTGALLDFFKGQAGNCGRTATEIESDVLKAVSGGSGETRLAFGGTSFLVLNLALIDNLGLARAVFERMLDPARWSRCGGLKCRAACPIFLNVELINRRRGIVLERLFLAYRRMYEYGTRLTLRQITEHLAYLVTSGLSEADIAAMFARRGRPLKAQFMFFNRFFGDDGTAEHSGALRMRAVREVRHQGFGERPCPTWERKLWLKVRDDDFHLGDEECDPEFDLLRKIGASAGRDSGRGMTPDQAREQVRRMLYFLYDFRGGTDSFLFHFLNSPMVLRWREWQEDAQALGMNERSLLEQRIYHVLQEHFTGVRLPEGTRGQDRRLYITLSRGKSDIRQTAQVVVAQVDWSAETSLGLVIRTNAAGGSRTDLELRGRGRVEGASLQLTLPFLDYVVMRHLGEVGETLQAAYVERLERFKARLQDLAGEGDSQVMLVRLRTDHTFRRQHYSVRAGKLEVNDAL